MSKTQLRRIISIWVLKGVKWRLLRVATLLAQFAQFTVSEVRDIKENKNLNLNVPEPNRTRVSKDVVEYFELSWCALYCLHRFVELFQINLSRKHLLIEMFHGGFVGAQNLRNGVAHVDLGPCLQFPLQLVARFRQHICSNVMIKLDQCF